MSEITAVIVEEDNLLQSITIDPVVEDGISSISSSTEYNYVTSEVTTYPVEDNLVIELALVENVSAVTSVNGKTGAVVIDYPDIGTNPVNHVRYVHNQATIASEWTINHNLNFFPNVTVMDNQNRILETDLVYLNSNTVKIVMNTASSGTAYLT